VKSEDTATFDAPPDRVWRILADWRRYPSWMPDVAWVRHLGGPEDGEGMRLKVRTKVFGVPAANDVMMVTAWEPGRRMAIRHQGVVRGPAEWRLDPVGEGTRFTWWEEVTMPPGRLGELALRIYWPWQRRMFRRSIENLRRLAEGPPGR
jgi:carbon monoxide dehydrogenase subunit G